jgi:DNA polymerase (family 10)
MSIGKYIPLAEAARIAEMLVASLRPLCQQIDIAGSIRRQNYQVRDIDIACAVDYEHQEEFNWTLADQFGNQRTRPERGNRMGIVAGIAVQVSDVLPLFYGGCLIQATGSADFNIFMRHVAKKKGWKLNNKGLWTTDPSGQETLICDSSNEESIFTALGVPFLTPQERSLFELHLDDCWTVY